MITDSILIRYLSGESDQKEENEIKSWIERDPENREYLDSLKAVFEGETISESFEMEEDWQALQSRISIKRDNSKKNGTPLLTWMIRAAAIIILVTGTVFIINMLNNENTIKGTSDEPVASVLPDGSEVFLTKGSRLKYFDGFNVDNRAVEITGEAFFKVKPGSDLPFIVNTNGTKIKVTGTSFHVSAPANEEDVEVVVRSGKVLFYNSETFSENSFRVDLGPGDKGIYYPRLNQLDKTHDSQYKNLKWN
jgi:ferric-dicitrate binding protein FerR (iron transport regulator)